MVEKKEFRTFENIGRRVGSCEGLQLKYEEINKSTNHLIKQTMMKHKRSS